MASRIQQVAAAITAIGSVTPWIKHDYYQCPFDVTLAAYWDSVLAATLSVQCVYDDQSETSERTVTVVQAGSTTATITDYGPSSINGGTANQGGGLPFGHGLITGDVVFLKGTQNGADSPPQTGYAVTVTGANTYTVVTSVSQTSTVVARVTSARILPAPTALTAITARAQASLLAPCWMSRLICTAFTTGGKAFLVALQGGKP
jgi:hypothetical protein